MHMQLAVFCLLGMSMVMANDYYGDSCSLQPCGSCLGVYYLSLTRPGHSPDYEVVTFDSDGFFNGIASNQNATFSSFQGTWKCAGRNGVEATDFLFNFAVGNAAATLAKGVFALQLGTNGQVSGTLDTISYNLASTANPDPSTWTQASTRNFNVGGYKLLSRCKN